MSQIVIDGSWYQSLIQDLRTLEFTGIVLTKWNIGKRLSEDMDKFGKPEYGSRKIETIADELGTNKRELYRCLQFFEKCHSVTQLPQQSWREIVSNLLPEHKEKLPPPPLPEGKYQVIYADPPWEVQAGPDWGTSGESRDLVYPTMTLEEIISLPVSSLSDSNAHLYLWTINKYIYESYEVAKAWGFDPVCLLTWVKSPHGIGLGGTFVQTTEHLLFCRKGTLEAKKRIDTTWFEYKRGRHSEKPKEFRKMIEEVSPGNRIELFAREKNEGWNVWGNEV